MDKSNKRKYTKAPTPWRFLISAVLVVLQLAFTMVLLYLATEAFLAVRVIYTIIWVIFLLIIFNRDESASYKLPWAVIILLVPFAGIVLLLMFGKPGLSRKAHRRFKKANRERTSYLTQSEEVKKSLEMQDLDGLGISNYLNVTAKMPVYANTDSEFLSSGERFFERLKADIKSAKEYVFLEFFIVSDGQIWQEIFEILQEKAKEGVKIHILYDDFGSVKKVPENISKICEKAGIKCFAFNPVYPIISVVHNNRDHRKIAVIDGQIAYTGGVNLADEYANVITLFGHWKDCGIRITGDAVDGFVAMFIENYNFASDKIIRVKEHLREHESISASGFVQPFGDGPRPVDEDYIGQTLYLSIINSAKKYLYIASPYFIVDTSILEAIETASKRGVDVKILTPHIPDKKSVFIMTRSSYARLIKAGVKIYEYEPGFIHSKTVLCDDRLGVVGTINFDYRSFVHNYECGAMLYGTQSILHIKRDYLQTIEENGILQTEESAKLKWYELVIKTIAVLFAPLL